MSVFAAVLFLAAYADVPHAWFSADDFLWLQISEPGSVLASFAGPWGHGAAFRPIARLLFLLEYRAFGQHAVGWHAIGLVIHLANGGALFVLVRRLSGGDALLAGATTALFLLLPALGENTIWISGQVHSFGSLLTICGLLLLDRGLVERHAGLIAGAIVSLVAAIASYEGCVYGLPFAGLLVVLRRGQLDRGFAILCLAALAGAIACLLAYRATVIGPDELYPLRNWWSAETGRDLTAVLQAVGTDVQPSWAVWVAALAVLMVSRGQTAAVGIGVLAAALGYAPFALFAGNGGRFLYASNMGVALAMAAVLVGLWRASQWTRPAAIALAAAAMMLDAFGARQAAVEWRAAGDEFRSILAQLTTLYPEPDPARPIILFMPWQKGQGGLAITYLDLAVVQAYFPRPVGLVAYGTAFTDYSPAVGKTLLLASHQHQIEFFRADPERLCLDGRAMRDATPAALLAAIDACRPIAFLFDEARGKLDRMPDGWARAAFQQRGVQ